MDHVISQGGLDAGGTSEELTLVINDRWSLNARGRFGRFDCFEKLS